MMIDEITNLFKNINLLCMLSVIRQAIFFPNLDLKKRRAPGI